MDFESRSSFVALTEAGERWPPAAALQLSKFEQTTGLKMFKICPRKLGLLVAERLSCGQFDLQSALRMQPADRAQQKVWQSLYR